MPNYDNCSDAFGTPWNRLFLVISHSDNDHLGGGEAVFRHLDVQQVESGEPGAIAWARSSRCRGGQQWEWDGVRFEYLAPTQPGRGNNASCVLRVETADGRAVLLPGDIERSVENRLLGSHRGRLGAEVMVAPHHGSRTSSTPRFVRAVAADLVLFGVGYRNRFGFPRPAVFPRGNPGHPAVTGRRRDSPDPGLTSPAPGLRAGPP